MTNTSTQPLRVDGVRLDTLAYNIETLGGRLNVPGMRGENVFVPGQHGSLWSPKFYEEGSFAIKMWVQGCDINGAVPALGTDHTFRKNLDTLSALFGKRGKLMDVRQTWPQGERQCFAEVQKAIDFSTLGGVSLRAAKFAVAFVIPEVFWQDIFTTTQSGIPANADTVLTSIAGATAPIGDGLFTISNPTAAAHANPRVMDIENGSWFQWNGSLAAGASVTIDSKEWTITGGGSSLAQLVHGGSARFIELTPTPTGDYKVRLGAPAGLQLAVTARRKFLS